MLRRPRRPAAALGAILLLAVLAACGGKSDQATDPASETPTTPATSDAISTGTPAPGGSGATVASVAEAVTLTGDVGKSLTGAWHSTIDAPTATTVSTLVKGKGATVSQGDTVSVYLWVGDATTKKQAYSDYTNGSPEMVPNNGKLNDLFAKLLDGSTYGSRVVALTNATELLGSSTGNPQLGIGGSDALVVVADVVSKAAVSPTPTDSSAHDVAPSKQPKVVVKNGKPVGLDFTGIAKPSPSTPLQRVVLTAGKGAVVKATDTLTVNYLGEVYQAKAPFDESYTKTPLNSPLSGLIPGWSVGLTGLKVGSRVLLQIPPAQGYGAAGSGSTIPGNATLWFVIDIVKVG